VNRLTIYVLRCAWGIRSLDVAVSHQADKIAKIVEMCHRKDINNNGSLAFPCFEWLSYSARTIEMKLKQNYNKTVLSFSRRKFQRKH